jgi:hypothetical protein
MSRKPASKKSFRLQLGKFEGVPSKTPLWVNWKERREFRDVEFGGVKFKALYNGYSIMVGGEDAGFDNYGYLKGSPRSYTGTPSALGSDGNSCAYLKICPRGASKVELAGFAWWLENMYLPRGTVAYLTKNDGNVEAIKRVLNRRGFRQVCVNKSLHTGNYPVYLLVHTGDKKVLEDNNNKGATENADVLGNSNAGVPEPGVAGDLVRRNDEIAPVPVASALVEDSADIEQRVAAFGHDILVGRAGEDAADGYGNAA